MKSTGKYEDIINLPHHTSKKHPRMSLEARSAQFAPFAALTGYDDVINETARLTNVRKELNEEQKNILDEKLKRLKQTISTKPKATFIYFVPDSKKSGGEYITVTGKVKMIDRYKQILILEDNTQIPIKEIIEIIEQ